MTKRTERDMFEKDTRYFVKCLNRMVGVSCFHNVGDARMNTTLMEKPLDNFLFSTLIFSFTNSKYYYDYVTSFVGSYSLILNITHHSIRRIPWILGII